MMAVRGAAAWVLAATAFLALLAVEGSSSRVLAQAPPSAASPPPLSGSDAVLTSAYLPPTPAEVSLFTAWLERSSRQVRARSSPPGAVDQAQLAIFGGPGDTGVTSAGIVGLVVSGGGAASTTLGDGGGGGAGGMLVVGGNNRRRSRRRRLLNVHRRQDAEDFVVARYLQAANSSSGNSTTNTPSLPPAKPPAPPASAKPPAAPASAKPPAVPASAKPPAAPASANPPAPPSSKPPVPPSSPAPPSSKPPAPPAPPAPPSSKPPGNASTIRGVDVIVAQDGSGNFKTVQEAVNGAPGNKRYVVFIKRGTYTEKVEVSKHYVTLRGEGPYLTKLTYSDTAASAGGTSKSASVIVTGNFFSSEDLEYANGSPRPDPSSKTGQAVAFRVMADQAAFFNVRFIGYQDTLYSHRGRHYFKNCYVRGSVDFIFGNGAAMFLDSDLYADVISKGGYLTAQKRETAEETTGFVFLRCKVNGNGLVYLGRPWGNAARTVFAYTYLSEVVQPLGWDDWSKNVTKLTIFYGEYKNTGPGAELGKRVNWAYQLTDAQAKPFLTVDFIQGKTWISKSGLKGLSKKQ